MKTSPGSGALRQSRFLPVLILIVLSLIWGSSFILIKKGLDAFDAVQVGTIRITFAFIVMTPIAVRYLREIYKESWKKILSLGLVANLAPAILFAVAETELTSSLTGILNALTPLFTLVVGALFFSSKINFKQTLGLTLGFTGTIILTFMTSEGGLGDFKLYALFVVLATLCYGFSANMVKSFFPDLNSRILTALTMFSIGPIALIYLMTTDFVTAVQTHPDAWASLGYLFILGAVGTAFALVLFNKLIQVTTPVFASAVTYLMPIVAVAWGLIDGERLFPLHFAGMALIIAGVYIVNRNK